MNKQQKIVAYGTGFILGCLILAMIPRPDKERGERHPWHEQTAPPGTYPMTVTDDLGREVTFTGQPRWFVSLAPSVTEIFFAMGMGDHLLAVTEWCRYPAEADAMRREGRHIGSLDRPDRESIAAMGSDLIVGTDLTPREVLESMERPPRTQVLGLKHGGMTDLLEDIALLGRVTGVPGKAVRLQRRLRERRGAVEAWLDPVREEAKRRVLFVLSIEEGPRPGWAPGRQSWLDELILESHAVNVAGEVGPAWGEVSMESLLAVDPEVLVVREGDTEAEQREQRERVAALAEHAVWRQVTAVREGRVVFVPSGSFSIPGPRMMEAYAALAGAIWGDVLDTESLGTGREAVETNE